MDVSKEITPERKAKLRDSNIECIVLRNILKEREENLRRAIGETMVELNADPNLYVLKVNFQKDEWELQLKPDALVLPNRAERRHPIAN